MRNIQSTGTMYGKPLTVVQINKTVARRLFIAGKQIYAQTSNYRPFGVWQNLMCVTQADPDTIESRKEYYDSCVQGGYPLPVYTPDASGMFDDFCDSFRFYNCDSERGRYISFYKER